MPPPAFRKQSDAVSEGYWSVVIVSADTTAGKGK